MAIGERIKWMRKFRNMTQRELGESVGFSDKAADIRIAQYESGTRTPKEKVMEALAYYLNVSPMALDVPDIDTEYGLMHTLFALEDKYGFKIAELDGQLCITMDLYDRHFNAFFTHFDRWHKEYEKLQSGTITEEEYNEWRYTYPEIPAKRLRDAMDAKRGIKK